MNHPTQTPLKLCTYLLKSCKQTEGYVLTPFSGSGTECVAAKCLKLNYIGFEINKDYIDISNKRLSSLDVVKELSKEKTTEESD